MPAEKLHILEAAKQGDPIAIAALINRQLQPKGITAKVARKQECLQVILESTKAPNQQACVEFIRSGLTKLQVEWVNKVQIWGREAGDEFPSWQAEFEIVVQPASTPTDTSAPAVVEIQANTEAIDSSETPHPAALQAQSDPLEPISQPVQAPPNAPFWMSIMGGITETAEAVSGTVSGATAAVGGAAFGALTGAAGVVGGTVSGAAGAVGSAAVMAGEAVGSTAGAIGSNVSGATGVVGSAAVMAGEAISSTVVNVAGAMGNAASQTTDSIGYLLDMVKHSPQLQELTRALKVDGFLHLIEAVDIVKAEAHVKNLQQKYPNEKPNDIAHRIMLEKAIYVGGLGLTSSLMPGVAIAMFAVDLAATTAVQAEMVYQIACAYGLNLYEPARKAEVLAIFGLAFGGCYALKVGLGFARSIPGAGPAIGAGSNAAMLYALGYGACRFYEAKLTPGAADSPTPQAASEAYMTTAIAQQMIMDQILVHVVLAGNPDKDQEQILLLVQDLGFSAESLHLLAANIQSLPALDDLLDQLDRDFAVSLAAQCQKIVQVDGVITPEEQQVITAITSKLNAVL